MSTASKPPRQLSPEIFGRPGPLSCGMWRPGVPSLLTFLEPEPSEGDLPARMPSPFAPVPHALARRAAKIVASDLMAQSQTSEHDFGARGEGKMLGVLVVLDGQGRVGFLRAVSGTLGGSWMVPGYVPPLFDVVGRDSFWPDGQAALAEIERELEELLHGEESRLHKDAVDRLLADHQIRQATLAKIHAEARLQRAQARAGLEASATEAELAQGLAALAEESRRHRREGKQLRKELSLELAPSQDVAAKMEAARLALKRRRTELSNSLLAKIQDGYNFANAEGARASLREVFAPETPPGGSGDCAAPKLLAYANAHQLRPIALAEFWWGASPIGGGRHAEHFYPPCKRKCGPLLPFLMRGIDHDEAPLFATESVADEAPLCLYEDEAIAIVDKPSGMLSVPGAHARLQDSAQSRLRIRYPEADGPLLVHRLDLDTSGLLAMAKSLDVYRRMQALFAKRQVEKRYVAWLDGAVQGEDGEIRLALGVDLDDRPRQIYDPVHGKEAVTEFRVLERHVGAQGVFTKVELRPKTGRTHQLRVHAAHALGLGAPIIGDRLYGKGHGRLLLHALHLGFSHPISGEHVDFQSPLPQAIAAPDFDSIHLKL